MVGKLSNHSGQGTPSSGLKQQTAKLTSLTALSNSAKNQTANKFTFPAATISLDNAGSSPVKKLVSQKS